MKSVRSIALSSIFFIFLYAHLSLADEKTVLSILSQTQDVIFKAKVITSNLINLDDKLNDSINPNCSVGVWVTHMQVISVIKGNMPYRDVEVRHFGYGSTRVSPHTLVDDFDPCPQTESFDVGKAYVVFADAIKNKHTVFEIPNGSNYYMGKMMERFDLSTFETVDLKEIRKDGPVQDAIIDELERSPVKNKDEIMNYFDTKVKLPA